MKVFYNPKMVWRGKLSSPSPMKPALVMKEWKDNFAFSFEQVLSNPCSEADLCLAHDPNYVAGVLDGSLSDGFGNTDPRFSRTLLYTNGSMLDATKYALKTGEWACSPTSGFHHAGYKINGGFCTFNGLAMSAIWARNAMTKYKHVVVLDCDYHYGDGTQNVFDTVDSAGIWHLSAGEFFHHSSQAPQFLNWLELQLDLHLPNTGIVLYQAGADPHVNDPMGGFLTDAQLSERDEIVFKACAKAGVPVVWNLAGGYQEPIEKVLDIHTETMRLAQKLEAWVTV